VKPLATELPRTFIAVYLSIMYEHIYRVGKKPSLLSVESIVKAEKDLGFTFPMGYKEYVTELGNGYYCEIANVYFPEQIVENYKNHWEQWSEEYWWESELWTREIARQCMPIAHSLNGDHLLFHAQSEQFYYLNRGTIEVFKAGSTLQNALDIFVSTSMRHPFNIPFFIPESYTSCLFYLTYEEELDCQKISVELQRLSVHSKSDEHDYDIYLYVPEILGLIQIYDTGVEVTVSIYYEDGMNTEMVARIVTCLENLGLTDEY
jgi:hypothetical protein